MRFLTGRGGREGGIEACEGSVASDLWVVAEGTTARDPCRGRGSTAATTPETVHCRHGRYRRLLHRRHRGAIVPVDIDPRIHESAALLRPRLLFWWRLLFLHLLIRPTLVVSLLTTSHLHIIIKQIIIKNNNNSTNYFPIIIKLIIIKQII